MHNDDSIVWSSLIEKEVFAWPLRAGFRILKALQSIGQYMNN